MTEWKHIAFVLEDFRNIDQFQEAIELATLLDDFECAEMECLTNWDEELTSEHEEQSKYPSMRSSQLTDASVHGTKKIRFTILRK